MKKTATRKATQTLVKTSPKKTVATQDLEASFLEVVTLIQQARQQAFQAVNTTLIDLYWRVGAYISRQLETAVWGEGVVKQLAAYIAQKHPDLKGFTRPNLFRMRQFFEAYRHDEKVSPLVRQLPWTHNLIILSQCKRAEEREFYLRLASKEKWSSRELERQIRIALFERAILNPPKVSAVLRQLQTETEAIFKDSYVVDFLAKAQPAIV
jgi:predicted nuclease of restriction endonuclease-like (RecB) superfamily